MSRRARHMRFGPAGAHLHLDARRITGIAGGGAVATWSDISGNARDATQGTGARQPSFQTNVLNGNPVVRFDGGDGLATSAYSASVTLFVFAVFVATGNGMVFERGAAFATEGSNYIYTTTGASISVNGTTAGTGDGSNKDLSANWGSGGSWQLARQTCDGTHTGHTLHLAGVNQTLSTFSIFNGNPGSGSANLATNIGARNNAGSVYLTGDIAAIAHFPTMSAALAKRIEHSLARSFKMSCA